MNPILHLRPLMIVASCLCLGGTAFAQSTPPAQPPAGSGSSIETPDGGDTIAKPKGYKFNSLGNSANADEDKRKPFKFVVPGAKDEAPEQADPVKNIKNDAPFEAYPGYPKHSLGIAYKPLSAGFSEKYNGGLNFNFGATALTGFDLDYKFISTPRFNLEVEYSYYQLTSPGQDIGNGQFRIDNSTTTLDSLMARANYCFIGSNFNSRLCPWFEIGYDSYPSYEFLSSSQNELTLSQVRDTVVGLGLGWMYPINPFWTSTLKLGYDMGLQIGQTSSLTARSDAKWNVSAEIERGLGEKSYINATLGYDYRTADVAGKVGANSDDWNIVAGNLYFMLGYRYEFGN